jgi:apolipoprotein N-acyltransferase
VVAMFSRHGTAGSLAYSQMDALPVIQVASIAGTSGIVFLVSLFASTVAVSWYHRGSLRRFRAGYSIAAALMAAALAFGFTRLARTAVEPGVSVGLVAIDTPVRVHAASPDAPLWITYRRAIDSVAQRGAKVVVMPEKIAPLTPAQAGAVSQSLAHSAESDKIYVLAGVTIVEPGHKENRAWLFDPSGHLEADYAKRHLVPGFEDSFVPGGRIVDRIIEGTLTGIAICKDLDFPRLGRDYGRQGVTLMLVPAWDFHSDGWLHSRMAILRGVEDGFSIARAARDGLLTISDRYGRVLYQAPSSRHPYASLVGDAPVGPAIEPFYVQFGNVVGWLILGFAVLVVFKAAVTVSLWNWLRAGSR